MKKAELIVVPVSGIGHIVSTIEFAKNLIELDDQLFITVLAIKLPNVPFLDSYLNSLTHSHPNIRVIDVPQQDPPPFELLNKSIESYFFAVIDSYKPHVKKIVADIILSKSSTCDSVPVVGIVLDVLCVPMIDIGDELGIPPFIFLTSGAGFLNLMLYLPSRHQQIGTEFSFSDPQEVSIPGFFNPVPTRVLPEALSNKNGGYDAYVQLAKRFKDVKGIARNF